jgi:hypothetical protein
MKWWNDKRLKEVALGFWRQKGEIGILNNIYFYVHYFTLLSIPLQVFWQKKRRNFLFFLFCALCLSVSGSTDPMNPNPQQSKQAAERVIVLESVAHLLYKQIHFVILFTLYRLENLENAGNSLW